MKKRPLPQLGAISSRVSGGHANDLVQQPTAAQSSRRKKQKQPANSGIHDYVSKHAYQDEDGTRTKPQDYERCHQRRPWIERRVHSIALNAKRVRLPWMLERATHEPTLRNSQD